MISTYVEIAHKLITDVTDVRWIDIDQGQLDDLESFDAILPPAVLIGGMDMGVDQNSETDEGLTQEMSGYFTTKTIINLPNDTHITKLEDLGRFTDKLKALDVAKLVRKSLEELPNVRRTSYKDYHISIKKNVSFYIVEQHFTIMAEDDLPAEGEWVNLPPVIVTLNPFMSHGD